MSVTKFRFVSPGVQTAEIDNSQLPRLPDEIGPVIIGRSQRGPMMRPVRVDSFSDFVNVFGEPLAGGQGGDVWRDGNRLTPTYAAYAAQAYLKNSSPVTFVRLGGYEDSTAGVSAKAGWKMDNAYGLFLCPATSSGGSTWTVSGSAILGAVLYSTGTIKLVGTALNAASGDTVVSSSTFLRIDNTNCETRLVVNNVTASFNFNQSSKKYIRNVLNTNPTAYADVNYFLGESFAETVELSSLYGRDSSASSSVAVVLMKLTEMNDFREPAQAAETGWIVSQHLGVSGSMILSSSGECPELTKLFKVVGLTEGSWVSENLKISIEDIKLPANEYVKYGTFTVSIRRVGDSDVRPEFVERFSGLSLDPSSENYIAKRIGDKYTVWDSEKKSFVEYGMYDNKSKFIRVQMALDVDNAKINPALLPFGFYGPATYSEFIAMTTGAATATVVAPYVGNTLVSPTGMTASFKLPQITLLDSSADDSVSSLSAIYWGLRTNKKATRKVLKDYVDFVKPQSANSRPDKLAQFLFTLDDVSGTVSNGVIMEASGASWQTGNRASGKSITAASDTKVLLSKFNKFTVPLLGGSDGVDVTKRDPFANSVLDSADGYAFNSVKVAINSVSDPEVVEMNLATMPGITNSSLQGQLLEKCELRADALAVLDLKGDYDPETNTLPSVDTVVSNVKNYANTSYGCTFFPWVMVKDTINGNKVWVPPSVVALGTFSSSQRKTELWFAPAGFNRGGLSDGAAGLPVLQTSKRLNAKERDALYEVNINPIASFPAEGIVIFGQKTLQVTPSAVDRINVRRLMIYLKREVSRMASTVLFDPNVQVTWKRFTDRVNPFLASVQSRFGLSEYKVILDETTTTADLVDRNIVYAKIMLKPTRAIEFIALDFVITNTGASFND